MGSITVAKGGRSATITVAANESIAVFTRGVTKVMRLVGYPNVPSQLTLLGTVSAGMTVFGPYSSGASIVIDNESGGWPAYYETGTDPVVKDIYAARYQGAPVAVNATATLDPSDMLAGIVTSTTASAVTATLPTGTIMDAASEWAIGDSFDWAVINTGGANSFTVSAGTGHTIVGAAAVAASSSAIFRTRKTAANTFITYRITT